MQGKWRNDESFVLPNLIFSCTHQIFIHHRRFRPLRGSSCTFSRPSLTFLAPELFF
jgi:hypothetical protein